MAKKHGLGRGLGALIKEGAVSKATSPVGGAGGIKKVSVSSIEKNPFQPRTRFESEALKDLTASIKEHGVLQPLLVTAKGNGYELIAGERRLRASMDAGLDMVPVVLMNVDGCKAVEITLIENLQREDLSIIEEGEGYLLLSDHFDMTQEEIARRVGKPRASIANSMRTLSLPAEVKKMIVEGKLSAGHAKVLSGLNSAKDQSTFARKALNGSLSVRNLEKLVQKQGRAGKKSVGKTELPSSHLTSLCNKLHAYFGTKVRIVPCKTYANGKKGKGSIEIDYFSSEDLGRLLEIMGFEEDE